jgi:hypothetical protein
LNGKTPRHSTTTAAPMPLPVQPGCGNKNCWTTQTIVEIARALTLS